MTAPLRDPLAAFVRDFRLNVDRCVFAFTMTRDDRLQWARTEGAHPRTTPCLAALIAAGLRRPTR